MTGKKEYGLGKVGARKALQECSEEKDFYAVVLDLYENKFNRTEEDLLTNMQLLYLLRKHDEFYRKPL